MSFLAQAEQGCEFERRVGATSNTGSRQAKASGESSFAYFSSKKSRSPDKVKTNAKRSNTGNLRKKSSDWIPAFAGMTNIDWMLALASKSKTGFSFLKE
jgi:hypothetical protein